MSCSASYFCFVAEPKGRTRKEIDELLEPLRLVWKVKSTRRNAIDETHGEIQNREGVKTAVMSPISVIIGERQGPLLLEVILIIFYRYMP